MKKTNVKNKKELMEYIENNFSLFFDGRVEGNTITISNGEKYKIAVIEEKI